MTNGQILALAVFAVLILLLCAGMFPASRKLNGSQKYRRFRRPGRDLDPQANRWQSIPPIAAVLAFLTAPANDGHSGDNSASDSADSSGGADGGGGGE